MKVERVVLDTNVLISATLSPFGKPFACLSWGSRPCGADRFERHDLLVLNPFQGIPTLTPARFLAEVQPAE